MADRADAIYEMIGAKNEGMRIIEKGSNGRSKTETLDVQLERLPFYPGMRGGDPRILRSHDTLEYHAGGRSYRPD